MHCVRNSNALEPQAPPRCVLCRAVFASQVSSCTTACSIASTSPWREPAASAPPSAVAAVPRSMPSLRACGVRANGGGSAYELHGPCFVFVLFFFINKIKIHARVFCFPAFLSTLKMQDPPPVHSTSQLRAPAPKLQRR